jgi:putative flippase GtrA
MIVGAFTFRRARDFASSVDALVAREGRVNGEFYVDSLVEDAMSLGLDVRIFEIDHYIGWGTPNDLKTFEYWQSCFHKWRAHPYSLGKDRRVPPSRIGELEEKYAPRTPSRPAGTQERASSVSGHRAPSLKRAAGEGLRFIPVGVAAVLTDYLAYMALVALGADHHVAKAASFLTGALVAFLGNRYFTFGRAAGLRGVLAFAALYAATLALNVGVNAGVLALLPGHSWRINAAFLVATGASAAANFVGMKLAVFTRAVVATA